MMTRRERAMARYVHLREAGVPRVLSRHGAWVLSGGLVGKRGDHGGTVPLATVVKDVPDCEAFLADYLNLEKGE